MAAALMLTGKVLFYLTWAAL